jgi:ABC-type multidrug transport system fused ATPase/permease subunit
MNKALMTVNSQVLDVAINIVTLTLILTHPGISGAAAGFTLAFAGEISYRLKWLFTNLRTMELRGISLERTTEYRLLPHEDGYVLDPNNDQYSEEQDSDSDTWPEHGSIKVQDLHVRYGPDMPDILHGVSFCVQGGQTVGIVGATGGGKSTLAKAFFSFVDITQGKIEIDGRDISQMPLSQVRSKLGIIAQDPILLSGTLRLNLDIEGKFSNEQLYDSLHQVQLSKQKALPPRLHEQMGDDTKSGHIVRSSTSCQSVATSSTTVNEEAATVDKVQMDFFANLDSVIKTGGEK